MTSFIWRDSPANRSKILRALTSTFENRDILLWNPKDREDISYQLSEAFIYFNNETPGIFGKGFIPGKTDTISWFKILHLGILISAKLENCSVKFNFDRKTKGNLLKAFVFREGGIVRKNNEYILSEFRDANVQIEPIFDLVFGEGFSWYLREIINEQLFNFRGDSYFSYCTFQYSDNINSGNIRGESLCRAISILRQIKEDIDSGKIPLNT